MTFPTPDIGPESVEYWAAANERRLLLRQCQSCGTISHYPRPICPRCMSDDTKWIEASGEGTIYSFTVMRRGPGAGTVPAFVTLEEGPTMPAAIVDADPETVAIGQSVTLRFVASAEGQLLPMFTPAEGN